MKRSLAHIFFLCTLAVAGIAQTPGFYLGFDEILDNREYSTPYVHHQTIFGARINPGLSMGFDSLHTVRFGINYMYEFGGELLGVIPQLDIYYKFQSENVQLHFGSFPRKDLMDYPLILLTDTLNYYRPNMEGASIYYGWEWGHVHGWVDWIGRISPENRESILAGLDASVYKGSYYLTTLVTQSHLSRLAVYDPTNHLQDDGSVVVIAGADLSDKVMLDELDLSTGWVTTYRRVRPSDPSWTAGWLTQLDVRYGIFGLKGTCYLGDGPHLVYGDPLYRSGNYGRIDLFVDPFKNPHISSKFGWNFHLISGYGLRHSQQILISIML